MHGLRNQFRAPGNASHTAEIDGGGRGLGAAETLGLGVGAIFEPGAAPKVGLAGEQEFLEALRLAKTVGGRDQLHDGLRPELRRAVNEAVQPTTSSFAREFAGLPGAKRLLDAHEGHVIAVTQSLLDRAVAEGEIPAVDTAAVAHVLGGLGREFAHPDVAPVAKASPKATADALAEIILRGLAAG